MTINTKTNVLMLTFENIEWDYSHETDKVVSFVENNKYQETPLKTYSYPYIRAQRMAKTGSADQRILGKADKPMYSRVTSARSAKSAFSLGKYARRWGHLCETTHCNSSCDDSILPISSGSG